MNKLKMPPKHWDPLKLKFFGTEDTAEIQSMAAGLTQEEVLSYYGISELEQISEYDAWFFIIVYNRGRVCAKQTAVEHLFGNMRQKGGTQGCLSYLTRFATEWPENETDKVGNRTMRIIME